MVATNLGIVGPNIRKFVTTRIKKCSTQLTWQVVVVVVVKKMSKKLEKLKKIGTDLRWFGGDFGMVWEYFREDFGPSLKKLKI